ncbi:MAG TPA: LamG domain-containing protein [Candidatus Kryptonia bacterium]
MRLTMLIVVGFILVSSESCNKANVVTPQTGQSKSTLAITLSMKDAPADVASIVGILTREGFDTVQSEFVISGDSATCEFASVPVGSWDLTVNALDINGAVKYSGRTSVQVFGGQTTSVYLVLNSTTGSISVVVTWGTSSTSGNRSLSFDGSTGYVEIPDSPSLINIDTAYTLEAWVKPEDTRFYNYLIAKGVSDLQYTMELLGSSLNPAFTIDGVTIDFSGASDYWSRLVLSQTLSTDQWTHLAITYRSEAGISIYINGNLVHHCYAAGSLTHVAGPLRFGVLLNETYQLFYKGELDEVRVWNTARTSEQIADNMRKELTGDETNLVGFWDFNDSSGSTTVADKSPYHNSGVLHGGVTFSPDAPF